MTIKTIRRLAADILGIGQRRVRFSPEELGEIGKAMMRTDVKELIKKGSIKKVPEKKQKRKNKKNKRGRGSRKGSHAGKKARWMAKVRSQRKLLSELMEQGALEKKNKREIYLKVKGGMFRSKRAMLLYLKENDFIPKDFELKKKPKKKPREKPRKGAAIKAEKAAEKKEVEKK